PILLHPEDLPVWRLTHQQPPAAFPSDHRLFLADTSIHVLHTPGHTPGSSCFYIPELSVIFTGDTLFHGGPGATGRSFSDFPTIISSLSERILTLPPDTVVHPGHGQSTTIGAEARDLELWISRGH
ncbi:MAG: MBL fold metallo-hydrolase, partial [Angustibacter sp.]